MSRSVAPGEWYAVLGESVVVLMPPAARERVAAIWEQVDAGAGFDEVLDALISRGLRELPGFVLVSRDGADVKVVIRGAGRAELTTPDGPVTVEGSVDTTWVERSVSDVSGLRLRVAPVEGASYAVGPGLVRVAEVEEPATAPPPTTPPVPAPTHAATVPPPVPVTPEADLSEAETGVLSAPEIVAPIPPPPAPPGHRAEHRAEPEAPESPEPPDGPESTGSPSPEPPEEPAPSVARLVFSSGQVIDVAGVVIVGRAPRARRPGDEDAQLVTVPSPHQEISSTHVEFRPGTGPEQGSAVVTDLGSTNGTVLVQPGLRPEDLHPGVAVQLNPGAIVDLGEGLTIQVAQSD